MLVRIQRNGVSLDADRLEEMTKSLGERLAEVEDTASVEPADEESETRES